MTNASLLRRLCAIFYDTLIILAIILIGTACLILLNKGQAISPGNIYYQWFLIILIASYFIGFWVNGSQTIGMKAWNLRVLNSEMQRLNFWLALLRFVTAGIFLCLGGIGLFWCLFNKRRESLYDKCCGTRLMGYGARHVPGT